MRATNLNGPKFIPKRFSVEAARNVPVEVWAACMVLLFCFLLPGGAAAERFFRQNSTWYEKIPANPQIMPNSDHYVNDILINNPRLSFSSSSPDDWSVPVYYATGNTPAVTVQLDKPSSFFCGSNSIGRGWNIVPIEPGWIPAGNASRCSGKYRDGHMTVVSHDKKYAWDFFNARICSDGIWKAACVRRWDLSGDGVNSPYDLKGLVRAASVPLLHGLVTYNEVASNTIDHALAFCYWGETALEHWALYPTEEYRSGPNTRQWAMLLGERLQLDPSVDCNALPLAVGGKRICRALQEYGMIFVENCGQGSTGIYGEMFKDWYPLVGDLSSIPLKRLRVLKPIYHSKTTQSLEHIR